MQKTSEKPCQNEYGEASIQIEKKNPSGYKYIIIGEKGIEQEYGKSRINHDTLSFKMTKSLEQ